MIEFIKKFFFTYYPAVRMDCFYGASFETDRQAELRRAQQIKLLKKKMGDKYLLAKPIKRKGRRHA